MNKEASCSALRGAKCQLSPNRIEISSAHNTTYLITHVWFRFMQVEHTLGMLISLPAYWKCKARVFVFVPGDISGVTRASQ